MKLFLSHTSPFGRLCVALAMLKRRTDLALHFVNPWENPPELEAVNPFSQIPVLVTDDGHAVYNTHLVCACLDEPSTDPATLARIAYATSLLDVTIQYVKLTRFKAPDTPDHPLVARSLQAIGRALAQAPDFDPGSEQWADVMLGLVLETCRLRAADAFAAHARSDTRAALKAFCQRDLVTRTSPEALETRPATIGDL